VVLKCIWAIATKSKNEFLGHEDIPYDSKCAFKCTSNLKIQNQNSVGNFLNY
jgi:hypothetical protein